jgi:putative oxidoreductase
MSIALRLTTLNAGSARAATATQDLFLLALRAYVAWQFLKSGWLKLEDWETTRLLFEEEYHVPWLAPAVAAVLGTAGETVFPVLLIAGVCGRLSALGLFAVNAVAVISYAHVLLAPGNEAAVAQHWLWGLMLLTLVVFGPGRLAVDGFLEHRAGILRRRRAR